MAGWILLHRRFFDHPFWTEKREFSKAEAWIDLIEQARWKDEETSLMHNGQIVKWNRGQLVASVRFLRDRWKWRSNNKVSRFLDLLEKEDMIRYDKRTAIGRITICKYDTYQTLRDAERDTNGTQTGQAEDKTVKKGKERKEKNILLDSEIQEIYSAYPRKVGKAEALRKINMAGRKYSFEFLIGKVREYAKATNGKDKQYIPYPATWFHQERFNDDPSEWGVEQKREPEIWT